ncbi:MAG: hypothetical protein JSU63_07975 [Phycisphaerales bacterium]|nr:MAG: hypothetical protein JSU63_07975 [Phycisphaerales bacterium]
MSRIDELVVTRTADKGDLYVHQDANWNVIGLTDLGGNVVERYTYTPYGRMAVDGVTGPGDYDGDFHVGAADRAEAEVGGACRGSGPTGACRLLDLDFDDDVDDDDLDLFDDLPQGLARHPGRTTSGVDQPFGHQGLLFEPEIGSYQNRTRQLSPATMRFMQRDRFGIKSTVRPRQYYSDGMGLYAYERSAPLTRTDAFGLQCGSGWSDAWVPEYGPAGCPYGGCCQKHDNCYGTCGSDFDQCNTDFRDCLMLACKTCHYCTGPWYCCNPVWPLNALLCFMTADVYYSAVAGPLGFDAFNNAQAQSCEEPEEEPPPPDDDDDCAQCYEACYDVYGGEAEICDDWCAAACDIPVA